MSTFININGKLLPADEAGVRTDNRAFRYGYGLFETMLVRDGTIRLAHYHWERLFEGMALLRVQIPKFFREELEREALRTIKKSGLETLGRLRLQVYAGNGRLNDGDDYRAGYVIEVFPLAHTALILNATGLILGISDVIKHTGPYAHLKTSAALPYAIAARQAKDALWNDALLLNEHGNIADSTIANIFWTEAGKIYTTPRSDGCVGGVMRRHLLAELPYSGYEVSEKTLLPQQLFEADSVFLSNAIRGIKWVKEINGHSFPPILPHLYLTVQDILR